VNGQYVANARKGHKNAHIFAKLQSDMGQMGNLYADFLSMYTSLLCADT
jgi:hypothetical protein